MPKILVVEHIHPAGEALLAEAGELVFPQPQNAEGILALIDGCEALVVRNTKITRPIQGLGYRQYPRLLQEVQSLSGSVARGISRPTDAQVGRQGELVKETSDTQQQLNTIVNTRINKLNQLLRNLPHIVIPGGGIIS